MIHPDIQVVLPEVIELFKKHKIKKAYTFGSALTRNSITKAMLIFSEFTGWVGSGRCRWSFVGSVL